MLVEHIRIVLAVEDLHAVNERLHSFVGLMDGIKGVPKHGRFGEADDMRMRDDRKARLVFADIRKEGVKIRGDGIPFLIDNHDLAAVILIGADGIFMIEVHLRFASRKGGKARVGIAVRGNEGFEKLIVIQKLGMIGDREEIEKFLLLHLAKDLVGRGKTVRIRGVRMGIAHKNFPFSVGIRALCLTHRNRNARALFSRRHEDLGFSRRREHRKIFSLSEPAQAADLGARHRALDHGIGRDKKRKNVPREGGNRIFGKLQHARHLL